MTPAELDAYAVVMIRRRIQDVNISATGPKGDMLPGHVSITLHPSAFNVADDGSPSLPEGFGEEPKCDCGHSIHAHGANGLCFEGCLEAKCVKPLPGIPGKPADEP